METPKKGAVTDNGRKHAIQYITSLNNRTIEDENEAHRSFN